MRYLTLQNLLGIVERIPGAGPVKDLGLLDSALARPSSSFAGVASYPTIELKAAALLAPSAITMASSTARRGWLSSAQSCSSDSTVTTPH